MIKEACAAITNRAKAVQGFWSVIGGRFWFTECVQDTEYPYCVFRFTGTSRDEIMGDKDDGIIKLGWTFILVNRADDGGVGISEQHQALQAAFDWCTMSIDGYSFIAFRPVDVMPLEHDTDMWQITTMYELQMEKE